MAISKELGFLQESPVRRRKRLKLGAGEGERVSQGEISLRSNNLSDHLAGAWSPMTKQMARAHSNKWHHTLARTAQLCTPLDLYLNLNLMSGPKVDLGGGSLGLLVISAM